MALPIPSMPAIDPKRIRTYFNRLPLATRLLIVALLGFYVLASFVFPWFSKWAMLTPNEFGLAEMHRLNTYPLLHLGFFHLLLNAIAVIPLVERFEAENGSLVTLLLLTGPFATLPGLTYVFIEKFVFHFNTPVAGASIWVFLLLASEALKAHKTNPNFQIGPYHIPTWTAPLIGNLFVCVLLPRTSFIGHLCGIGIGSLWGLGYVRFLVPSERILRWVEGKLNLLGRVPHYVSVDQKTYGRYGILPSVSTTTHRAGPAAMGGIPMTPINGGQRLGP